MAQAMCHVSRESIAAEMVRSCPERDGDAPRTGGSAPDPFRSTRDSAPQAKQWNERLLGSVVSDHMSHRR